MKVADYRKIPTQLILLIQDLQYRPDPRIVFYSKHIKFMRSKTVLVLRKMIVKKTL